MRAYLLKKRGSLSLSINAIVVLIMAITMLGLGLAFMRNTFKSAASSMEGATAEIEKQTIDSLKTSGKKVGVSQASLILNPRQNKGVIVAVTNTEDTALRYGVEYNILGCSGDYAQESLCTSQGTLADGRNDFKSGALKITVVNNMGTILQDDAKTVTLAVDTSSGVGDGTLTLELKVCQEASGNIACAVDNSNLHGTETVTITTTAK